MYYIFGYVKNTLFGVLTCGHVALNFVEKLMKMKYIIVLLGLFAGCNIIETELHSISGDTYRIEGSPGKYSITCILSQV